MTATSTPLEFTKLEGAGNDFVGLDWRARSIPTLEQAAALARHLCPRQRGIGADGLIFLLDPPADTPADFRMRYINADGSLGEMCGNGARCAAVFAHHAGAAPERMTFVTDAGLYRAQLVPGGSRIAFPDIPLLPEERTLQGPAQAGTTCDFLLAGVPHAVRFVEDLDLLDIATLGREIRYDPAFAPAGTNANFAEERGGILHLRTYERGVEAETLACGTGSVATACCWAARQGLHTRVTQIVIPTGGDELEIEFTATGHGFQQISLAGPARIVFEGRVEV